MMADYIDRQAVLDAIWPVDLENDGSDDCTVVLQNQSFTSADIEAIVCGIPAADVRPVVHARWEYGGDAFEDSTWCCSSCREPWTLFVGTPKDNGMRFCPYCGAKMDGGETDEAK